MVVKNIAKNVFLIRSHPDRGCRNGYWHAYMRCRVLASWDMAFRWARLRRKMVRRCGWRTRLMIEWRIVTHDYRRALVQTIDALSEPEQTYEQAVRVHA